MTQEKDKTSRTIMILLGLLVLLSLFIIFKFLYKSSLPKPVQQGCVKETEEVTMGDSLMSGIIEPGEKIQVLMNYYECNPLQRGDVVLYRFSQMVNPVIKIVRAIEGDKFELEKDEVKSAWNLLVNGDKVMHGEEPYFFGGATKPTISLYEKSRNNVLAKDEAIVLSNVPPGGSDSGIFGLSARIDIIGKVKNKTALK
jgi:hypothetical protein